MLNKHSSIDLPRLACGILLILGFSGVAIGGPGGGGGGGGGAHGGGGGHTSGGSYMGGGSHVSGGGHFVGGGRPGGGYGRYPGGGYRGGFRGYRGFGGYGFGFGAGLGVGLYFAALPLYYSTYWWGGIPYYYADDTFYTWDGSVGQYQTIDPPAEVEQQAESQAITELIAYPKNGQSDEQQAKDKSDCQQWAATQSGYNPAAAANPAGAASPAAAATSADPNRENYLRAEAACLDARGYSVT
jgi:hypothetical protein